MSRKRPTALGAYIFAGGFTLGVNQHFNVLAHFEDGPFGVATTQKNFPKLGIYADRPNWPIKNYAGVDFVYANPPCASWSNAGSRIDRPHWKDDPNSACWSHTAELIWKLRPKIAAIESVRPIYTKGRKLITSIAAEGRKLGYQPIAMFEDALDCCLPQKRPRFMLILTQLEYLPSPTHGEDVMPKDILKQLRAQRAVIPANNKRAAAPDLSKTIEGEVLKHTPPGGRLSKCFNMAFPEAPMLNGKVKGRPSMLKYRIHPDKPSPTQPGGAILFHPKEDRYLNIAEAAALCGYPPDYEFVGSISSCYAQMGKAVLPNVGMHVAYDAARTIKRGKKVLSLTAQEIVIKRDSVEMKEIDL